MKKLLLGMLMLVKMFSVAAQGLEDVIVEKIPVTAAARTADPSIPEGAVAYRVFVDMTAGYEMQAVFGDPSNELIIQTTTSFYNNADGVTAGRTFPNGMFNDAAARFDSYVTIAGFTSSRVGILVSEDADGTADGYTTGTSLSLQMIGADFETPFGTENYSGKFSTSDGVYNINGGAVGTTANNRVLIGQFTTDGIFSFELNIQIRPTTAGDPIIYVAKNPTGLRLVFPKLNYSSQAGADPVVSITSPANGSSFTDTESVPITASASDADGTISLVEFFADGNKIGEDATSPYQLSWLGTSGTHQLTARATDNSGNQTTSAAVTVNITTPVLPVVSITAPANGSSFAAGSVVTIAATATDADGTVTRVEFFRNGVKLGEDLTSPYSYNWTAVAGPCELTAVATDNNGNVRTSSIITITVTGSNVPPTVSITAPANNSTVAAGTPVSITATATDTDGTIAKVEFFVNSAKIGEDITAPYQLNWTAVAGSAAITAVATDNGGSTATSTVVNVTVTPQSSGVPVVSITSPATGAQIVTGTAVTIEASATDAGGSITLVEFLVNGVVVGQDASAPYQYTWTAQAGIVNLAARATDNDGNTTISKLVGIMVGSNFGPRISITSPSDGSSHAAGSALLITAQATDADGTVAKVEFFVNGTSIGEDLTSPYEISWTAVSGEIEIYATATDNDNRKTTSDPVVITVSAVTGVPPVVTLTSPANNAVFTAGTPVNITADATDADGTITLVEFYNNGIKIGEDNTSPYAYSWISVSGSASLTAKATDNAGNQSTSSPVVISVNGAVTANDTLVFDFSKAVITNNHYLLPVSVISGAAVTSFSFSTLINTAHIVFDQVMNHTTYLTNTHTFDQATKKLTVSSTSQQPVEKNTKLISVSFTLVTGAITPSDIAQFKAFINNAECAVKLILTGTTPIPPTVSINSPVEGASFNAGTSIPVTALAADADGTVSQVEFFVNGTFIGKDNTSPYQVNWTGVAGTARLKALATDNQGNQSTSVAVTIHVTDNGNKAPVVKLTSPVNKAEYPVNASVTIGANASDSDGTIASVYFYVNDSMVFKDVAAPFKVNWITVAGTHEIKARAIDNKGAWSLADSVTIYVNAQPSISITSPVEGALYHAGDTVTFTAAAHDADGTIALVEFFVNGAKVAEDNSSPYQYDWISVPGKVTIQAIVTDSKGAKTTSSLVTCHVNATPVIRLVSPEDGITILAGEMVRLEAEASDPDGSIARVDFFINNNKVAEDSVAPYLYQWASVAGEVIITAKATDNRGGEELSQPVSIKAALPYVIPPVEMSCIQDRICIPLNAAYPLSNVYGIDVTMVYDTAMLIPTGNITLGDDLIDPVFADYGINVKHDQGQLNISVYMKSTAPEGTTFNGTGNLLCVEFSRNSNAGVNDSTVLSVSSLVESYITGIVRKTVQPGTCLFTTNYFAEGTLKYWSDGSPICYDSNDPEKYHITDISGANPDSCSLLPGTTIHPDLSGSFRFDVRKGNTLRIDKDIAAATEVQPVVNGADALLILKTILGDNTFIPSAHQMIAMDVNMDGAVSSGDLSQINQRSIKMIKEFKQVWNYNNKGVKIVDEPSRDWHFIKSGQVTAEPSFAISSNYPLPDATGYSKDRVPAVSQCHTLKVTGEDECLDIEPADFTAIMLGDVNGNYGSLPSDGKLKSTREDATIYFDLSHALLEENNVMRFPVYFNASYSVTSLDFALRFTEEKMEYDTIYGEPVYMEGLGNYNTEDSTLRYTSYSLSNYQVNTNLFYIQFRLLNEDIEPGDFDITLSLLNGLPVSSVVADYTPVTGIDNATFSGDVLVYPNPARDVIFVEVPDASTLEIIDMNGRIVISQTELPAGEQNEINVGELRSGMYLMRLVSGNKVALKKISINR